jgi:hypothetical protein
MGKRTSARETATGLRKTPRQARSGETFESILEAAARMRAAVDWHFVSLDALSEAVLARRAAWIESDTFRAEVARLLERYLAPD